MELGCCKLINPGSPTLLGTKTLSILNKETFSRTPSRCPFVSHSHQQGDWGHDQLGCGLGFESLWGTGKSPLPKLGLCQQRRMGNGCWVGNTPQMAEKFMLQRGSDRTEKCSYLLVLKF